jgi:hypothetical protein
MDNEKKAKSAGGALMALILAAIFVHTGCDENQSGHWIVTRRESKQLGDGICGRIDCLFGTTQGAKQNEVSKSLVTIICFSPEREFSSMKEQSGDGRSVSIINLQLHKENDASFGFGSAWNRISDVVVIDSKTYSRADGNLFLVLENDNRKTEQYQIEIGMSESDMRKVVHMAAASIESHNNGSVPKKTREKLCDSLRALYRTVEK